MREALAVSRQITEALEAAYERGIIHRDLKPANVKITPVGRAKLLDFGLAQAKMESGPAAEATTQTNLTKAGTVLGTLVRIIVHQLAVPPRPFRPPDRGR